MYIRVNVCVCGTTARAPASFTTIYVCIISHVCLLGYGYDVCSELDVVWARHKQKLQIGLRQHQKDDVMSAAPKTRKYVHCRLAHHDATPRCSPRCGNYPISHTLIFTQNVPPPCCARYARFWKKNRAWVNASASGFVVGFN